MILQASVSNILRQIQGQGAEGTPFLYKKWRHLNLAHPQKVFRTFFA